MSTTCSTASSTASSTSSVTEWPARSAKLRMPGNVRDGNAPPPNAPTFHTPFTHQMRCFGCYRYTLADLTAGSVLIYRRVACSCGVV